MRLLDLVKRLPDESVCKMQLCDEGCDVYTVGFLTEESSAHPREDVLYFGDTTMLPKTLPAGEQFSCVVMGEPTKDETIGSRTNVNIVWLANGANPYACYNLLQAAFMEEQRFTDIVRRLLEAHLSNRGLQYVVEEAAVALGNPIVVIDTTYRYIAYHLGDLEHDNSQFARVMQEEIANETVLEKAIAYIRDQHIDSAIAQSDKPYEQHNQILGCNTMTTAVMVRGVCIAHIMMVEHSHEFMDLDRAVFEQLAGFVAQEMQKSEVWGPTSGEMGSYFLANLLADSNPSNAVTQRRMKALNFHPKPVLYLVCLHSPGEGLTQMQVERVAAQLRPVLHHSLYTRYHQQLVILLSRAIGEKLTDYTEPKIKEVATLNGLTVGISNPFGSITSVKSAYEQSRAAIRFGELLSNAVEGYGLYHFCDVAYVRLFDLGGRRSNLLDVCHPALLKLAAHDRAHSSELMDTLFCYLQMAGSTVRAAKFLHLHKNTLLYRINRIKDIAGINLDSGENLFQLQVGFRILLFLGLFTPRNKYDQNVLTMTVPPSPCHDDSSPGPVDK